MANKQKIKNKSTVCLIPLIVQGQPRLSNNTCQHIMSVQRAYLFDN